MRSAFDRRVMPEPVLVLVRALQGRIRAHLGGGSALSGAWLAHRLSRDVDFICHTAEDVRTAVRELPDVARECGTSIVLLRDAGTFIRMRSSVGDGELEIDVTFEANGDLAPPAVLEGVALESLDDQRASKLTCLLSRTEPRDLVDLLFLDRAGYSPESSFPLALRKDAGIDPAVLGWLLGQFPTRPLPRMLEPITEDELRVFRDELRERFRRVAIP